MRRYPALPATSRAIAKTLSWFGIVMAPPISSEDREIADSFDVAKALREARAAYDVSVRSEDNARSK